MAFIDLFKIQSKAQRAQEQARYDCWAFPEQGRREAVERAIAGLLPEEPPATALTVYLIGRQAYRGDPGYVNGNEILQPNTHALSRTVSALKKQLLMKNRPKLWRYLALIVAEGTLEPGAHLPCTEDLIASARNLEQQLSGEK